MAFRRADTNLPKDVDFPASLTKLGFKIDTSGRIVDIKTPNDFFRFDKYEKHHTNQKRYNAVHKAVRQKVHDILTGMGVKPIYMDQLDDKKLCHVGAKKPETPSMKILSSPGFSPFEDKELYVVIGDSKQDLGIWSRKIVLTEGGLNHGSAVGLVAKLRDAAQPTEAKTFSIPVDKETKLPGVIILNPGELLYSHKTGETMSAASWNDRQREHGFADKYNINEQYNLLPGHESPEKHVKLCLRYFLKPIVGYRTRVNIIAIGDASEAVLKCLNEIFEAAAVENDLLVTKVAIAMIQPTHNADIVTAPALQDLLAKHGRTWEAHSSPKGTLLADVAPELKPSALPSSANLIEEPLEISSGAGNFKDRGPITDRRIEDLGSLRQIEGDVPDTNLALTRPADDAAPETNFALAKPAEDAASEPNLTLVHVGRTGDIESANEDNNEDLALDPYFRRADYKQFVNTAVVIHHDAVENSPTEDSTPVASHCDPVTAEWIKNGSFSESKEIKNEGTTSGTQLALGINRQIEGVAPGNIAHTAINKWIERVEPFGGDVNANTALATKPSSFEEDKKSDGEKSASPTAPETHLVQVADRSSEGEGENDLTDTPPGEFSPRNKPVDYFRGPGLSMAMTKRPATVAEPPLNKQSETSKEDVAVDEHMDNDPVTMIKVKAHNAPSQPIPVPPKIQTQIYSANEASDKQIALADAKKTGDQDESHAYPYYEAHTNCPTYSAGIEDTTEMIFPEVMQDVVGFFQEQKDLWG